MKKILLLIIVNLTFFNGFSQVADTTSTSLGEYPYVLPFLGQGAYDRGYDLPLPFNISIGSVYNKQGILLDNLSVAFTQGRRNRILISYSPLRISLSLAPQKDGSIPYL